MQLRVWGCSKIIILFKFYLPVDKIVKLSEKYDANKFGSIAARRAKLLEQENLDFNRNSVLPFSYATPITLLLRIGIEPNL